MVKVSKQKLTIVNCACRLKHFPDGFLSKERQSNCNLIRKTNKFRHSMFYLRYVHLGTEYAGSTAKSRLGKAAVEGSKGKFSGYCGAMPRTLNSGKTLFSCRPKT